MKNVTQPVKKAAWLFALLIITTTLLALCASAAKIYTDTECSLTLRFVVDDGAPVSGVTFRVYRIASVSEKGDVTPYGVFADYDVSFDGLDTNGWTDLANVLNGYVSRDAVTPDATGVTDENGVVKFEGLQTGFYLVNGSMYEFGDYKYYPQCFIVSLPTLSEDGVWQYDMQSEPKYLRLYNPPDDKPEYVNRRVLKVWNDKGSETKRPQSVTVQLLCDGEVYDEVTLSEDNNWKYEWNNLDKDKNWQIVEKEVPEGYKMSVSREGVTFVVRNSTDDQKEKTVNRSVVKRWNDGDGSLRPDSITVNLLRDGEVYESVVLNAQNGWSYNWTGLEDGHEWTVEEPEVPDGYDSSTAQQGDAFVITNTYDEDKPVSRRAVKIWKDAGHENLRPHEITVELLRDGEVYDSAVLNEQNGWAKNWDDLEQGHEWTIREVDVPEGYESEVTSSGQTFTIVNTYPDEDEDKEPVSRSAVKVWQDAGYENKRPSEITVELLCDGQVYDSAVLNEQNGWAKNWDDLEQGHEWTVREASVPEGYQSSATQQGDTFVIVNSYPGSDQNTVNRRAVKVWQDEGYENMRPGEITVELLCDGQVYDTAVLNEQNGWSTQWFNLEEGHDWTVREASVPEGYTSSVTQQGDTFVIVNSYPGSDEEQEYVNLNVVKIWQDAGNENKRPSEITVELLRDGEVYESVSLSEQNGWVYGWDNLEQGHDWTVREVNLPEGYEVTVTQEGDTFTIVNAYKKLPQTGVLWWPVPVLFTLGACMFIAGCLMFRRRDSE